MRMLSLRRAARCGVAAALLATTALAGAGLAASPAHAVPTLHKYVHYEGDSSSTFKTFTLACEEANQQVYGVSFSIFFGQGRVTMDDVRPNADVTAVTFTAYENGPFSGSWALYGGVNCGPDIGLERVDAISTSTGSQSPKLATAECEGTDRVYGAGAEITGGIGNVFFRTIEPNADLDEVYVAAYEDADADHTANWTLQSYAICGPPRGIMQRLVGTFGPDSQDKAAAPDDCPTGTRIHGVGAEINGVGGEVVLSGNEITPPILSGDTGHASAVAEENGPYSGNWSLTSYGICLS